MDVVRLFSSPPHVGATSLGCTDRIADVRPLTILAALGTLVESRPYLHQLAHDIATLPELSNRTWVSLGATTKASHPRHPL